MTCTLRILIDGRERLREDGVNLESLGFRNALKASVREMLRHNQRGAVTAIIAGAEHVLFSGRPNA